MVRDLQNVIELIDDLKATNLVNVQVLKKALLDINVKLEDISDGSELILVRNSLADFKEALDNKFQNVFNDIEKLKVMSVGSEISEENALIVQEKFSSLFNAFNNDINSLVKKIDALEEDFSKITDKSIEVAKEEFVKISQELQAHQLELLNAQKDSNEIAVEKFAYITEGVKVLSENINVQMESYKDFVVNKMSEIKEYVQANELELQKDENNIKDFLDKKFKDLAKVNVDFSQNLEEIKNSIVEINNKSEEIPVQTIQNLGLEFRQISETTSDALAEIKVLQEYSGNIIKTINKISEKDNSDENISEMIQKLNISQNIDELFEKIEGFNINFNNKTEFLEEQMLQLKSMFSDVSIDIANKDSEIVQKELERVKEYFVKIEQVSKSLENLEENLKLSGIEYKEHISTLNKELYEFISEFNSIYNEVSNSAQLEINNSLDELKQYISVNSNNYNDKLVIVQEQFSQAFSDLYEALKKNNQELVEGIKLESLNVEQERLLHEIDSKLNTVLAVDMTDDFKEITEQNVQSQDLIKNLHVKVDELLDVDSKEEFAHKQLLANKNVLEQSLDAFKESLTGKFNEILMNEVAQSSEIVINNVQDFAEEYTIEIEDLVKNSVQELGSEVKVCVNETSEKAVNSVKESIQDLAKEFDDVQEATEILKTDLKNIVEQSAEEVSKNVVESVKEITNGLDDEFKSFVDETLGESVKTISDKVQNVSEELEQKVVDSVKVSVDDVSEKIVEKVSDNKNILKELSAKLDVFVTTNDSELLTDELLEIKDIILEQQQIINANVSEENVLINENIQKLLSRIDNVAKTIDEHDENTIKIKEDLVNTVVSVFSNSSFIEETEEIKDFVEEKTDEISKRLVDVQSQLLTLQQPDLTEYSYTLSDVENDIAKLRQIINDMSNSSSSTDEINQISRNIYNLTSSIDSISKNLTPAEIYQLKHNILKLNDDILSISSRTNKLLLNSDESQKTIEEGLSAFSHIAYNLEERMQELSNNEFNIEIATKLEKVLMLLENAAAKNETFHQVFNFLGEWVDAASNTFENINSKADEIYEVSEALSELRKVVPEKIALIDMLEERFEEQQSRLDRLEAKIDEISDMSKMNSNFTVIQKVDKMEMLLSTLNANVEKLTSYVD